MFRALLVCLLVLFSSVDGISQPEILVDPYRKFDQFTLKNGLSHNYVLDIFQDHEGYLWVATVEGLNRFDGYQFIPFFSDPKDSLSLSSDFISCIAEDSAQNLWIGTKNGLNRFNRSSRTFTNLNNTGDPIYSGENIRAICMHSKDYFWTENGEGELRKVPLSSGQIKTYPHRKPSMVNTYFYHSILADKQGDIWIGGRYMGLYRFDPIAETFEMIPTGPDDPKKKRDEDVAVFFIDSRGTFWVGGTDGLYTFDPSSGTFSKQLAISTFSMAEDHEGLLWAGTGSGLFIYNPEEHTFRQIIHDDNNPASLVHNHITKVFIDRSDNVWIGTISGISVYRPAKNKFGHVYHIPGNEFTPVSSNITAVMEDRKGYLWLGTAEKGIDVFDSHFTKRGSYNSEGPDSKTLASDRISSISEDQDGDIWIGQWSGRGMNIINPRSGSNTHFRILQDGLMADWYNDILHDSRGNHWFGIWGAQGLYAFDKPLNALTDQRYEPFQMHNKAIRKMAFDGQRIWIAFDVQDRFYCYDTKGQRLQTFRRGNYRGFDFNTIIDIKKERGSILFITNKGIYRLSLSPYPEFELTTAPPDRIDPVNGPLHDQPVTGDSIPIYATVTDQSGVTWIGTDRGLIRKAAGNVIQSYRLRDHQGILSDTIWDIEAGPGNMLYLGTEKGLVMYDRSSGSFNPVSVNEDRYLSSHLVKFLYEDSRGFIWVGTTDKGLNRFNPQNGEIIQFNDNPVDSAAFWGTEASCALEDKLGHVWIGGMGLNRYDPKAEKFSHVTEADGLPHHDIMAIQADEAGTLWISTAGGLSRFDPESGTIENYFEKDGLQDNEFTSASARLNNGLLAFGGKNGLNIFDPKEIMSNKREPAVKVTGFSIFDEPFTPEVNDGETIDLKYTENYFSFEFTALDFSDPANNLFAYKLENFEDNWIRTNADSRVARYTNVDPGQYVFRVIASNSDGIWNETGFSVPLIIHPPFWRTGLFYGFIGLLAISLLVIYIKFREKKIQEQNQLLLLEQKLLRSQMNPHFIFNSLSSIQSFIFENNPVTAGSYLSRFADLIRAILYNSREEFIRLDKEIQTLRNYLDLQQLRYNNKFEYSISLDPEMDPEELSIPPMLAQPFIENAIEHGIKHIEGHGKILLTFELKDDLIIFTLEDNGIGLETAKKLKNSKAGEHRSLATVITRERIEVLNKSQRKNKYSVDIKEIIENGETSGTRVRFTLPVLQTEFE